LKPVFGEYKTRLKFIKFGLRIVGSFVVLEFALIKCRIFKFEVLQHEVHEMFSFVSFHCIWWRNHNMWRSVQKVFFYQHSRGRGCRSAMSHAKRGHRMEEARRDKYGFSWPGGNSANLKARRSFLRGSWRLCTHSLSPLTHRDRSFNIF